MTLWKRLKAENSTITEETKLLSSSMFCFTRPGTSLQLIVAEFFHMLHHDIVQVHIFKITIGLMYSTWVLSTKINFNYPYLSSCLTHGEYTNSVKTKSDRHGMKKFITSELLVSHFETMVKNIQTYFILLICPGEFLHSKENKHVCIINLNFYPFYCGR